MEYGSIKERLILNKLIKRLEKGEVLNENEMRFVEEKLKKYNKTWTGFKFYNGLTKLQEISKFVDEKKV